MNVKHTYETLDQIGFTELEQKFHQNGYEISDVFHMDGYLSFSLIKTSNHGQVTPDSKVEQLGDIAVKKQGDIFTASRQGHTAQKESVTAAAWDVFKQTSSKWRKRDWKQSLLRCARENIDTASTEAQGRMVNVEVGRNTIDMYKGRAMEDLDFLASALTDHNGIKITYHDLLKKLHSILFSDDEMDVSVYGHADKVLSKLSSLISKSEK